MQAMPELAAASPLASGLKDMLFCSSDFYCT